MKFDLMSIVYVIAATAFCGFFYYRMIKRETPKPIGWLMALLPIVGGMCTFHISALTGIKLYIANIPVREFLSKLPAIVESFIGAFLSAGMPEELYKGIVLIILIFIFKPKKVYEYILMGAGVGLGFTIMEELAYMETPQLTTALVRGIALPAHMSLNMVMGEFLGKAKYNKLHGKGSQIMNYILAFLAPAFLHTLYDAFAANNRMVMNATVSGETGAEFWIGSALFVLVLVAFPIFIYYWLYRCKKKTQEFCAMETVSK